MLSRGFSFDYISDKQIGKNFVGRISPEDRKWQVQTIVVLTATTFPCKPLRNPFHWLNGATVIMQEGIPAP
jgi:hypothetical protein